MYLKKWVTSGRWLRNKDGTIDIEGDLEISDDFQFDKLPVKFNVANGHFICSSIGLKTLEGCPVYVGETFDCSYNQLTSLYHCPKRSGNFHCYNNLEKFTKDDVKSYCDVFFDIYV